jgi:hypothetical protein
VAYQFWFGDCRSLSGTDTRDGNFVRRFGRALPQPLPFSAAI